MSFPLPSRFFLMFGCVLVMYWAILYPVRTFPPAIESVRWTYVGRFRMADEIKNHMLDETDMKQFYDELQKLKLVRRGSSWEENVSRETFAKLFFSRCFL